MGFNSDLLNGHSFRIGAATTPAEHKVEDHLIQTLGRWVSQSYVRYCHTAQTDDPVANRSIFIPKRKGSVF
jgi:hypothetical protein